VSRTPVEQLELPVAVARARPVDTSQQAARDIQPRLSESHRAILALLREHGDLTPDEAARLLGWEVLFARPRFTELHHFNLIKRAVKRRSSLHHAMWSWRLMNPEAM
jgi:hypothetical protein